MGGLRCAPASRHQPPSRRRSTRATRERRGADSAMILPPLLYRADRRELVEFFGSWRGPRPAADGLQQPRGSGNDLRPELLAELAREVPASPRSRRPRVTRAGSPSSSTSARTSTSWSAATTGRSRASAPARRAGSRASPTCSRPSASACGSCARPATCCRRASCTRELLPLARLDMTPKLVQYFKAALDELGLGGGPCRPPRLPLTEDELAVLRRAVERFSPARLSG